MTAAAEVQGEVEPGFEKVRDVLSASVADLGDGGAAYAAYHRGHKVVDLWVGDAGARAWDESTIAPWMSVTKAVVALCLQVLHDRGVVDVFAPVAKYWPEFGAAGKEEITVAQVLTHTSGVMGSPDFTALIDLETGAGHERTDALLAALAAAAPMWAPGTAAGYHTVSYGFLLGEVIHRADGRTLGQFFREEVALPLGVEDVWIGTPAQEHHRIATVLPLLWPDTMPAEIRAYSEWMLAQGRDDTTAAGVSCLARDGVGALDRLPEIFNSPYGRTPELGSSNLMGPARSVAKVFASIVEPGGLDGVLHSSPEALRLFTSVHESRADSTLGLPIARGLGYNLNQPLIPRPPSMGPHPEAFGHSGIGGHIGFADPVARVGVGFVRSHYTTFPVLPMLLHAALYESLSP